MRGKLAIAVATLATLAFAGNANARTTTVVPDFKVSVHAKRYVKHGVNGQHVKTIKIYGSGAKYARPKIKCSKKYCGNNKLFKGKTKRSTLYRKSVKFTNVNWVISKGRGFTIYMVPRKTGRYRKALGVYAQMFPPDAFNKRFTIGKVGCVKRSLKKRQCPNGAKLPKVNRKLAPPPVAANPPAPTETELAFVSESHFNWTAGTQLMPVAADFNRDGKADLSLRDSGSGKFYFRTAPTFAATSESTYDWSPGAQYQPFAGDFDGDGIGDIGIRDSSIVSMFARIGPSFGAQIVHDWVIGSHYHAFAGDFNGDGNSDLGVRNAATGGIFWHLGPTYATERAFSWTPGENYQLVVADFNGDKLADTALRDPGTGVFLIRFGPDFNTSMAYPWTPGANLQAFAADFDGNGLGDLAMRDVSTGDFWIRFAGLVPVA